MTAKAKSQQKYDVAIIGGGLSGLTMASLLGQEGLKVVCIDAADPAQTLRHDLRTTAVSYGSQMILNEAGIWKSLKNIACPIKTIDISDGDSPVLLRFDCAEINAPAFGWIVDNADLRQALLSSTRDLKSVHHLAPAQVADLHVDSQTIEIHLKNGNRLQADLVIGADGRESFVRAWMDGPERRWDYHQRALVCITTHEHPHHYNAVENFRPEGPFAILPMRDDTQGRHRSAIVWSEHGASKPTRVNLPEHDFNLALAAFFPQRYGAVRLMGPRQEWPLNYIHAASYVGPRTALVADAAHGMHPVAGQGLNMGFRDVKALADLLIAAKAQNQDLGNMSVLQSYERARRPDNTMMLAATDGLVRLFSNDWPGLGLARKAGLRLVHSAPPVRRLFMRYAMGV